MIYYYLLDIQRTFYGSDFFTAVLNFQSYAVKIYILYITNWQKNLKNLVILTNLTYNPHNQKYLIYVRTTYEESYIENCYNN